LWTDISVSTCSPIWVPSKSCIGETEWKNYSFWRKKHNVPKKDKGYGEKKLKANGRAVHQQKEEQKKEIHIPAKDGPSGRK
jgi:hypothetical protein